MKADGGMDVLLTSTLDGDEWFSFMPLEIYPCGKTPGTHRIESSAGPTAGLKAT